MIKHFLFLNHLLNQDNFKALEVIEINDIIRINYFYVHIDLRNNGVGSREIKKITSYADQVKKVIYLHATSSKNKRFYKRNGFVNNVECRYNTNMKYVPST